MHEGCKTPLSTRGKGFFQHTIHFLFNSLEQKGENVPHGMSSESQPPSSPPRLNQNLTIT